MENSIKSIPSINPAITEITEYSIIKVHASVIDLKVGMSLGHGVSLCLISSYFEHIG